MKRNQLMILAIAMTLLVGCDSDDVRLARMAQDSVDQQRAQNEEMARLNREVAHGV